MAAVTLEFLLFNVDLNAELGKNFLLMLSSHLLTDTRDYSCSLKLIQNFECVPQTHTHEDGDRSSRLRLTHTHFPKNSLLLTLIVVNTRQIGIKLMKKVYKQPFGLNGSYTELNIPQVTKNVKNNLCFFEKI